MMLTLLRPSVLAAASLFLLSGCAVMGSLERLTQAAPKAENFESALAAEYLGYSQSESEMGHPIHADYFAAKGLKAANGEVLEPEAVPSGLPELVSEQLHGARVQLMTLLTDDIKQAAPKQAARAMLFFDCWAHQQAKHAAEEGVPCLQEFESAIAELEIVAESFAYTREMEKILKFKGKEATLDNSHLQMIDEIAQNVSQLLKYQIEITATPSGRGNSLLEISEQRAAMVRFALMERGIPSQYIEILDELTAKTVFLSNDEDEHPRNAVLIKVKTVTDSQLE